MKKSALLLKEQVLSIKPTVLFRATTRLSTKSHTQVGIQVNNLDDQSFYEFKGRAACLWLLINGRRTRLEIIQICKRINHIKAKRFSAQSHRFFEGLLQAQLLIDVTSEKKLDARACDSEEFLRQIKKEKINYSTKKRPIEKRRKFIQAGDHKLFLAIKNKFSKVLKNNTRIKIKRFPSLTFRGQFHVVCSDISLITAKRKASGLGASLTLENAAMASVGEAIERLFSFESKPDIFSSSFFGLRKSMKNTLDPESFNFFSSNQACIKTQEVVRLSRKSLINWTWFETAINREKILIPADINGSSRLSYQKNSFGESTSSGCAVSDEIDSAKLKATLELIERDHMLFYWRTQNSPQQIDLSHPEDRIGTLLKILGDLKNRINLFYLKSELKTTTVQAVLRGKQSNGEPIFASTCATRLDPIDAMEKALMELIYLSSGLIRRQPFPQISYGTNFDNSIWEFGDRADMYCWNPKNDGYRFLFPKKPRIISWKDLQSIETGNSKKNLENLISDFKRACLRLYFKDNTPKPTGEAGFWVYRAFSPDLISIEAVHRYRHLGHDRYQKLANVLCLKKRQKESDELNTWPHPLP